MTMPFLVQVTDLPPPSLPQVLPRISLVDDDWLQFAIVNFCATREFHQRCNGYIRAGLEGKAAESMVILFFQTVFSGFEKR